ncbi:MAG: VWA domain-containing protein [Proteobacteria bacterium]|nr:VWA domain-containing protein [Pseudomonadota bacterium]MBS0573000.1 VWA domain-containing protein [Pseudomonadota bacterium]
MDEIDKLRAALKAAPPAADPAARAEALARAMRKFDERAEGAQETAAAPRPMSDRPGRAGFLTGVRTMLARLTARPALAATASAAALIAGVLVLQPSLVRRPVAPAPVAEPVTEPVAKVAPKAEAKADAPAAKGFADALQSRMPTAAPAAEASAQSTDSAAGRAAMAAPPPAAPAPADAGAVYEPAPDLARAVPVPGTEAFANADANPVRIVAEAPVSTFSIDVDTASYAVVRSSLNAGALPPPDAVRVEEMVNYFPYSYPAPKAGEAPFKAAVSLFQTPWNKDTEILRIGLQGALPAIADRPPLNLVFLIDTSGSMEDANKLPLLQKSLGLMLGQLRPEDRVAIVTYAGSAGLVLEPTPASDRAAILGALDRLQAGGSTAGQEGLQHAYQVAEGMAAKGRIGRILLATDGDFNVGLSDPEELKRFIAGKRDSGIYLSVLGFGRGNLDDATMQALAQNGNGTAAYIDTLAEAQKVLADQLTGALFPIADDVKIQVEFNPAAVAEYRLVGYETRALRREDFNNDRVDAGEIGAGTQVTALYEVTPVGSKAQLSDPLRYGPAPVTGDAAELGFLRLRYKAPGTQASRLIETPIPTATTAPDDDARFAAAIAGFGQLLRGGTYLGRWGWADAIALAEGARGEDPFGYRAEAVQLMRLAQSLSR